MNPVANYLFDYLGNVLYSPEKAELDIDKLPKDFQELGEGILFFVKCVEEVRAFANDLSRGNLKGTYPSSDNELAAPLKMLHSSLRHLTWQAQQVAKGDFRQHVDFLGDFADAFNRMTRQLNEQRAALLEEIANSRQRELALAQSNDLFEVVTKEASQWLVVVERESCDWLFTNYPVRNILAYDYMERQLRDQLRERVNAQDEENAQGNPVLVLEHELGVQHFSIIARPVTWRTRPSVAFMLTDVSEEYAHIHELEDVAFHDPMTRLFNRNYGMRHFEKLLAEKRQFALCFVDIDNLKYVNDKYGHNEGDKYIQVVAAELRTFAPTATVCRLGGDEFMLMAPDMSAAEAENVLEGLREQLTAHNNDSKTVYFHSMSYGVVDVPTDNERLASELLAAADEKMYLYKREHKMERRN
ncbi:MAG: GGDEF domain-containing protein [Oscillospiraceae bacterium]|jgi:diguanylate cyclase (GGDEF)-like protein|nr:GGDEF domain-containing protein [Oscillospiraceae bacterium]